MIINPFVFASSIPPPPTSNVVRWNSSAASLELRLAGTNLSIARDSATNWTSARATQSVNAATANHYFEIVPSSATQVIGVGDSTASLATFAGASGSTSWSHSSAGQKINGGVNTTYGSSWGAANRIGVLLKNGKLYFRLNGAWMNSADPIAETGWAFSGLTGQLFPMCSLNTPLTSQIAAFAPEDLVGSLPSGTVAWGEDPVGRTMKLNRSDMQANLILMDGVVVQKVGGATVYSTVRASDGRSSGKFYFEAYVVSTSASKFRMVGIAKSTASLSQAVGTNADSYGFYESTGQKYFNNVASSYGAAWAVGDTIGVAVDLTAGKIWFSNNGVYAASGNPAAGTNEAFSGLSGTYFPAMSLYALEHVLAARFRLSEFSYAPPAGFSAYDTYAIPDDAYDTAVLADAPVAYWKLNEPFAAMAVDYSGNNYHSGFNGNVIRGVQGLLPNIKGIGAQFNGTNTGITIPANVAMYGANAPVSIEAWVQPASLAPGIIFAAGSQATQLAISSTSGTGLLYLGKSGVSNASNATVPLILNRPVHVAATINSSGQSTYYINGIKAGGPSTYGTGVAGINSASKIGVYTFSNSFLWNGIMHKIAWYNKELTQSDVTDHYTSTFLPGQDPYLPWVQSLLSFDAANGSTVFTDFIADAGTWTNGSSLATIVNSPVKFGIGAMAVTGRINQIGPAGWAMGLLDFTIEGWAYATSSATRGIFDMMLNGANTTVALGYEGANTRWQVYFAGSTNSSASGITLTLNQWFHYAVVRNNGAVYLYIDGVEVFHFTNNANLTYTSMNIGAYFNTSNPWIGYLDEFRWTKGLARYTGTFTPPTGPFPRT